MRVTYELTIRSTVLVLSLSGDAPSGSDAFRWASPALDELRRILLTNAKIKMCRIDMTRLKYNGGDFLTQFVILPTHRGLETFVVGPMIIGETLASMLRGLSYHFEESKDVGDVT